MFSRIHEKLGTAGFVISIVALIAAMTGGAYAAGALNPQVKKQITKESKKFSKKFSKQFAKAGPQGATGATGAKGDTGSAGANGSNGTNGTNGSNGEPGMCSEGNPSCVLPAGGTLTGTWSAAGGSEDYAMSTVSFPLRVSPAPTAIQEDTAAGHRVGIELGNGEATFVGPYSTFAEILAAPNPIVALEEDEAAYLADCPGDAAEPEAEPGFLCIYTRDREGDIVPVTNEGLQGFAQAATEFGVTVPWESHLKSFIRGTWAVTQG